MAKQDLLTRIKERHDEATEQMRDQHARMREDAAFSNPALPLQQWPEEARLARAGRPMLQVDKTNQFVSQVVNDMRQNKPSIQVLPADSRADVAVAQKLSGVIRHIEYVSRAGIAYDTAAEHQVRFGLGWLRVVPQVMRPETNEQEIRVLRIHDPWSCRIDTNSTEPDGSDAMWGTVETSMTTRAFKANWPKAKIETFGDDVGQWFGENSVRVCEYLEVEEEPQNRLVIVHPEDGSTLSVTEDEYWMLAQRIGFQPQVVRQQESVKRRVKWIKASGADILEETESPSQFLPLIPVMGHESWVDGKRYLCGMVRRMMDSQRFHNYAVSAAAEAIALQPKVPFVGPAAAFEGFEVKWKRANTSNDAFLPYNDWDDTEKRPLAPPQRAQPPVMAQGWSELIGYSASAMEASVGMYAANLGKASNETSGRAIRARQAEGDTANFHFADNMSRSIEQLGRVVVDMIPRVYDSERVARIMGEDGEQDFVKIAPNMPRAVQKQGNKVVAINPSVGAYDVRVKTGPSYTTQRQETADHLAQIIQGNPQAFSLLGDVWVQTQDWPDAEKVARRFKAMLPPQVQAMENEDADISPEAMQIIEGMKQQIQQLSQALETAAKEAESAEIERDKVEADMLIRGYQAVTDRMKAVPPITPEQVQAIAMQTVQQALSLPPVEPDDIRDANQMEPPEMEPPEQGPPMAEPMEQPEPAPAGFFVGAQGNEGL